MTTCKRGHARTPENQTASRRCRLCKRELRLDRLANDPEFRAKERTRRPAPQTYDAAPFMVWLTNYLRHNPHETLESLAIRAGSTPRTVRRWQSGNVARASLGAIDRFLVAAGEPPTVLEGLYPLDDHLHPLAEENA